MSDKTKKTEKKPSNRFRVSPELQEKLNRAAAFSQQLLDDELREAGARLRRRPLRGSTRQQNG